jgi:hypothetical protein
MGPNRQPRARGVGKRSSEGRRHVGSALACGDHARRSWPENTDDCGGGQGLLDQVGRADSLDAGSQDADDVLAQPNQRANQFTFFGSDQAESPVRTSNFRSNRLMT